MKLTQDIDEELQNKEVSRWWNQERNLQRWDEFHYSDTSPVLLHVLNRQNMALEYLDGLSLEKGAKVLELGYGTGQMAKRILDRGYEYYGIDISSRFSEAANKRCSDYVESGKAKFLVGSIEHEYDFEDESFDVVFVCGALQYLAHPSECFREVYRVLKTNKEFVICQANMYSIRSMFDIRKLIFMIVSYFTKEEFLYSPCFRSILLETKLKRYFDRYKNSNWMNSNFMTKGYDEHSFDIKKRQYSYWRLKSLLVNNRFDTFSSAGTPFTFPKRGRFYKTSVFFENILQTIANKNLIPYFFTLADNIILFTKKSSK